LGEVELWGVALKMGRPLVFGHIGQCWFFGLAGNPVSAMINYLEIVRPIILHLAGAAQIRAFRYQVMLGESLALNAFREEYRRAILRVDPDGVQRVYSVPHQGSAVLTSMSRADCLIVVPRGEAALERDQRVWVEPIDF
ncbi:MAG: molybdopterin molybdenumtransferase MoeA, partial [Halothiobacillus sp.]|nr:molybdopterin molybdenumtransferase MoeA [Halothiobacillus sp.]